MTLSTIRHCSPMNLPLGQKQAGIVAPFRVQLQQTVHNRCIFHAALPHLD